MALEQARQAIEAAVKPGVVPSYPHPANLPQCMVHGHMRGQTRDLTGPGEPLLMLVVCRACGTVYALMSP